MGLHDLKTLIHSHHPVVLIETLEEDQGIRLLSDAAQELAMPAFEWSVSRGLCRMGEENPSSICPEGTDLVGALRHIEHLEVEGVFLMKDVGPHLENLAVQRMMRDLCAKFRHSQSCLVLMGARLNLPREIRHDAVAYTVDLPNVSELETILESTLRAIRQRNAFVVSIASQKRDLVQALRGMTRNQARQSIIRAVVDDGRLDASDIADLQKCKAAAIRDGGLLEYYPSDEASFELGGFNRLRSWLERAQTGFGERAQALNLDPPKGVLLLGVQGCGKSLAAKVIAQEWGYPLLKLDAGKLYDKYLGESEKNFHRAVEIAEALAPCVLWIDELEKAFSCSTMENTDGATSQRILGSMLTWLQESHQGVFVAATANNVDAIPPELMRKGRFDEVFFVDLPSERDRLQIWKIHLSRRKQNPDLLDIGKLVDMTEGFSGAEIEQVVVAALFRSLELNAALDDHLLEQEILATIPLSISRGREVSRLRRECIGRFVLASSPDEEWKQVA